MSLYPCSACSARKPGKYANVTFAWWRADNERTAWRQKLCIDCYISNVAVLAASAVAEPYNCPACHTDSSEQLDACYATVFLPGIGKQTYEFATCAPCAVEVRNRAQVGAAHLDDRPSPFGGQDPSPQTDPAVAAWRALGIDPRE